MNDGAKLPAGWAWASLSEVCEKIQDGTHFSPKNQLREGKYRYVTAKNVRPNGLDLSDVTYLTEEDHREIYKRCDVRTGDVLLVKDGVNTGDAAINNIEDEISILSSVCMLRPREDLLQNQFLRYYLLSPTGAAFLTGKMTGTAIRRIILKRIKETPIPLAPVNEQARIVERLEELLSGLDAGVSALERARAKLKRYRAAVLKAAVTGELTTEWRATHPNVEPATKLLDRILTERRRKWEADQQAKQLGTRKGPPKNQHARYLDASRADTTELHQLPPGWYWATIDQLSRVVRGASPRPAGDPKYFGGGHTPWITVGALTAGETIYLQEAAESLTEAGRNASRYVEPGTLLLTNSGATLGVPKITLIGGCINDGSVALLEVDYPLKLYLYFFLKSQTERLRMINQGAAQPNLNTSIVKSIIVPLPPSAEQEVINHELQLRLSVIEATENYIEASLKRAGRLRQSILKEAFSGRLVPQDPTDEPASVLLDRIRHARVALNGSTDVTRPRSRRKKSDQPELFE